MSRFISRCCLLLLFIPFSVFSQAQHATNQNLSGLIAPGIQIDLNGDGIPDIIGLPDSGTTNVSFRVALSKGGGLYQPWTSYSTIDSDDVIESIAVGDVNGDGKGDVVVSTCACGDDPVQAGIEIFLGNGDGTVQPPATKIPIPYSSGITLTDINHDGKPDLVLIGNNEVSVMYGDGNGGFAAPVPVYTETQYNLESLLLTGDFDGDDNADILVQDVYCNLGLCDYRLTTLYGDGNGNFTPVSLSCAECAGFNYTTADVNQDGRSDVVTYNQIFYGSSSRQFQQASFPGVSSPYVPDFLATVADFNGDGINDVAFLAGVVGKNGTYLGLDLGRSDGTFSSPSLFQFTNLGARFIQVGDYNNDQKPDILVNTASTTGPATYVDVLLNTLKGNFSKCAPPAPVGIRVCSPMNQSSVTSPVAFDVSAASFAPIRKIETWIDGHKAAETYYGWDVKAFSRPSVALSSGQHHADFYAVNYDNTKQHSSVSFNVK